MIDEINGSIEPVRIACVGASVTFGRGLADRRNECYPAVLQELLNERLGQGSAMVKNFGYSGATISRVSNEPYWETPSFNSSTRFRPHLVLIMLGTNDAQFANVDGRRRVSRDLTDLIVHYQHSGSPHERLKWPRTEVLVSQMPPAVPPVEEIDFTALANVIRPTVQQTVEELGVPLVDFSSTIPATREAFPDGLHPTAEIATQIAQIAFDAILPRLEAV